MSEPQLSHAEIWDDSYLQSSWDDAVEEYERYHSLAARGIDGPELIDELKRSGDLVTEDEVEQQANGYFDKEEEYEPGELDEENANDDNVQVVNASDARHDHSMEDNANTAAPPAAELLSRTVHDEGLKHIMMSWYYAGYYTGLHEGMQKGRTEGVRENADPKLDQHQSR